MLDHESLHLSELMRGDIRGLSERDGLEPEFRERAIALNMDVRWLVAFVTEKEEAVRTDAKDGRHSPLTISRSAASASESAAAGCWAAHDLLRPEASGKPRGDAVKGTRCAPERTDREWP